MATQVNKLEKLTKQNKNNLESARNAMGQAQLGILRPDFSTEGRYNPIFQQMEEMTALAEKSALAGWVNGAKAALEAADVAWVKLGEPRPSRPKLSHEARRAISITSGQRENWTPAHLSTLEKEDFRCIEDLSEVCYNARQHRERQPTESDKFPWYLLRICGFSPGWWKEASGPYAASVVGDLVGRKVP